MNKSTNKMTNLDLSNSIKNYIKELFDDNIRSILMENTKQISLLTEEITQLKNNFNCKMDSKNDSYAKVLTKNIEHNIQSNVSKAVITSINDFDSKKKSLIIFNVVEKKDNVNKIEKRKNELSLIKNIINIVSDGKQIEVDDFHRLGTFQQMKLKIDP